MGKYLKLNEAEDLLEQASSLNPGEWVEHSKYAGFVAGKIAEALDLDKEKAIAFGYIHDIGRRVGRVNLRHIYEGYEYLMNLGYEDAAKICLTHSFFDNSTDRIIGKWDFEEGKVEFVKEYIEKVKFDIYDRIIQLSDCLLSSNGIITLERRMIDVFFRYGFDENVEKNITIRLNVQKEIENKLGYSIYKLFSKEVSDNLSSKKISEVIRFEK